jgi:hypothetical protein
VEQRSPRQCGSSSSVWLFAAVLRLRPLTSSLLFIWAAAIPLLVPTGANAQALYGSIDGSVTDSSNAAIAGGTVIARNTGTGEVRQTTTNAAGSYSLPNLQSGTYDVTVQAAGFQSLTQTAVSVSVNSIFRVDARLEVGVVSEAVTVDGGVARLQTEQAAVRYALDRTELVNLPVSAGRNFQETLRLVPGITVSGGGAIRGSNPSGSLTLNVNGTSQQLNNTRIDGASSPNGFHQHFVAYVPALEAIETVEATTNSFDADQGLAGGAAINVHIKSGTNEIHGSAFEYHTNNHLRARPYFFADSKIPTSIFNQFGTTIGGPLKKNKLFYFFSYERFADRTNTGRFVTVPTAAAKRGDLSESSLPIYDPLTGALNGSNRQAFAGNVVPLSRQSVIARKLIPLWPEPNQPRITQNYFVSANNPANKDTFDAKINFVGSSKWSAWGRFGLLLWDSFYPTVFGPQLGGPTVSGQQPGLADGNVRSATVAAVYTVSPSFILDGYVGYNRGVQNVQQERLNEKVGLNVLGIPGTNGPRRIEGGWPRFGFTGVGQSLAASVGGYDDIGVDQLAIPWFRNEPSFNYAVNANWTKGKHNIRFGGEVSRHHLNHDQAELEGQVAGGAGGFIFLNGVTEQLGSARGQRANTFAAFLLGLPQMAGRTLVVPDIYTLRSWRHSYYIRDRWTMSSRLTVSYGVRWEYIPFPTRADRGVEFYNFDTNQMTLCGFAANPTDCGTSISKKGFGPRFGLAYRATDKFVIRAGYGITTDPFDIGPRGLRTNYPLGIALNLVGANEFQPALRLDDGLPTIPQPDLGNGIIPVPTSVVVKTVPKKIDRGYIQSWNFTVQRELKFGFVGQVGYVATRSVRQFANIDANAGQVLGASNAGRTQFPRFARTATTFQYRPFGTSQYNGLQARLERRYAQGVTIGVNYAWSKAIGVNADSQSSPRVQAVDYFGLNRAVVNYDRTHTVNMVGTWEPPFGKGKRWANSSRLASAVFGDWQLNNALTLMSGLPFSVTAAATSLALPGSTQRADQIKPTVQNFGRVGPGESFFDPLAFAQVTQPRFGNAGFNSLRGPGIVNWDFSVFRQFIISERWKLQFRMEAFNFSNTPHFANPGSNVSAMSLNADGSVRTLGGFSEITATDGNNLGRGGSDERAFRFGLRLSF